jgi:hypothetical protein
MLAGSNHVCPTSRANDRQDRGVILDLDFADDDETAVLRSCILTCMTNEFFIIETRPPVRTSSRHRRHTKHMADVCARYPGISEWHIITDRANTWYFATPEPLEITLHIVGPTLLDNLPVLERIQNRLRR